MKFMSIRDLRNQSGLIQKTIAEDTVTLTSNGRPFALVIGLEESEDPVELARLVRMARAQMAVSLVRMRAQAEGIDNLDPEEIDAEIQAARRQRSR